jgi:hypothetical protein
LNRTRAAWIAAGVVILAAVAFLARRRTRRKAPVTPIPRAAVAVTPAPVVGISTREDADPVHPPPTEEEPAVRSEVREVVDDTERPLATWVRVAIVVVALLAFFAVSLIATKQV